MAEKTVKKMNLSDVEEGVPELLAFIAQDDLQVELRKITEHLKKGEFEGHVDPRTLSVTDQVQSLALLLEWPFRPWITASAHNYGPDTAYLSINCDYGWLPLKNGEDHKFHFQFSEERIYLVYYRCDPGKTASVQINGKF